MRAILQVFTLSVISKVVLGITGILLIRSMPELEYARYVLALSAAHVATAVLATGFNSTYIIGYRRLRLSAASSSFLTLQLLAVAVLGLLALPLAAGIGRLYGLVLLLVTAICLLEFARTYFQRNLRFMRFSLIEFIRAITLLAVIVGLVTARTLDLSAANILVAQACVLIVIFLFTFGRRLVIRDLLQIGRAVQWMMSILRGPYRYLLGYTSLIAVMTQLDVLMIKALGTDAEVAVYGSAFRYFALLALALGAVHSVFLPVIQTLRTEAELRRLLHRHRRLILVFAPIVLLGAFASQWIIPLIDQGKYPGAIPVFRILAVSSIVAFAFSPHVNLAFRFEDFRFLFVLVGCALSADAFLNFVLIPVYGAVGAAWATVLGFGIVNAGVFLRARRYGPLPEVIGRVGDPEDMGTRIAPGLGSDG